MEKEKQKEKGKEKGGVEQLLKEKDEQIAQYERRIEKMRFDSMLDEKISSSRAKNKVAVRALIDADKLSVVDGKLVGAEEQINAIKQKDGYLFEDVTTGGGANPSHVRANIDMDALSDEEYFKIKFRE